MIKAKGSLKIEKVVIKATESLKIEKVVIKVTEGHNLIESNHDQIECSHDLIEFNSWRWTSIGASSVSIADVHTFNQQRLLCCGTAVTTED